MAGKNTKKLPRTLVESYVRKQIRGLKSSPEKGLAKLSDLAEGLANEQIKQYILKLLKEMLANKEGGSYRLLCHVLSTVNTEHLVTLGMNIGYNSLYAGNCSGNYSNNYPDKPLGIRSLEIDGLHYESKATYYKKHITEGKKSGIYTWGLFMQKNIWKLIPVIQKEKDCAFLIFCPASCLTDKFLDAAKTLKNLMLCIEYSSSSPELFQKLQKRKLPYSVFVRCGDTDTSIRQIDLDSLLSNISKYYPVFTFLIIKDATEQYSNEVSEFIKKNHSLLKYPTIAIELTI